MNDSRAQTIRDLEDRIAKLEEIVLLLTDFAMMLSMWLSRLGTEDTIELTKRWFKQHAERIVTASGGGSVERNHLLRFSRLFDEMDSAPRDSPLREKLWQDLIQKLRDELS